MEVEFIYENLLEPDSWLYEAKKLMKAGVTKSSRFGSSCPKCWKPLIVQGNKTRSKKFCQCKDMPHSLPDSEILSAHGLEKFIGMAHNAPKMEVV